MTSVARIIEAGGQRWRFLPEQPPIPVAGRAQMIARAQLVDELTGQPPHGRAAVSTSPGLRPAATEGGLIGLSGRPTALYPDPWPAPPPRASMHVELPPLFLPLDLADDLPPQPGWPGDFAALDFGAVALHRQPTRLSGRVASRTTGTVAGADVVVSEVWPTFAGISGPGVAPLALTAWAGLYVDRPAGAALRRRTLTLQPGAKSLLDAADAGDTVIRLSDRQSLVINRPLAIEPGDSERTEFILIAAIDTSSSADQPAAVTLAHPLRRGHPAGTVAQRTTFAVAGANNPLTRAARRGDVSLFAASLTGITAANTVVEIDGGGPPAEYHGFALWRTTSDADGAYRLPPVHRAAHLRLTASGGGQPNPTTRVVSLLAPGEASADLLFP